MAHRGREVVGNVAQRVVGGEVERRVAAAFVEEDAAGVVAEGSGSGKLLAVTAESKRCVDGAPVRRSGVATCYRRRRALGGVARVDAMFSGSVVVVGWGGP